MPTSVMWFRRDLRLGDNPALLEAGADGATCCRSSCSTRRSGVRPGLPAGATSAPRCDPSTTSSGGPALGGPRRPGAQGGAGRQGGRGGARACRGRLRPLRPRARPAGRGGAGRGRGGAGAHRIAVRRRAGPGDQRSGDHYKVFTPFSRAWSEHGWRDPVDPPTGVTWLELDESSGGGTTGIPDPALPAGLTLPEAGEAAAARRWEAFLDRVDRYADDRDKPGVDGTSHMSVHLEWGEIHPRTMLAALARKRSNGAATYRKELAWREFYADVLFAQPRTARDYLREEYARMAYDRPGAQLEAWQEGGPASRSWTRGCASPRHRLDAQPGADDRGQLPGQGPAPGVAARRPALPALAGGRRPGLEPARLAVDGRLRHRRGAVLPGLQPDQPGEEVRPRRPLRPAVGRGATGTRSRCRTRTTRTPTPATWSATRRRSSTTRRSGRRPSTAGRPSGDTPTGLRCRRRAGSGS